jgi:ribonuclease HII
VVAGPIPSLKFEREAWKAGAYWVAGVDEVGVGPLAGPVVAAAVVLPPDSRLREIDDSKKLTATQREEVAIVIRQTALGIGVGIVEVDEIDRINIYRASLEAMRRAVMALPTVPDHVVVDARSIPGIAVPQTAVIKGDSRCYSVAAASIVAKVTRDAMMRDIDAIFPQYGFCAHMGYATQQHLDAIQRHGPSPIHRRSFAPVRELRLPGL